MRARANPRHWAGAVLAMALSACHAGTDNAAEVRPLDVAAQTIPARPDPDQPVASGNTPAEFRAEIETDLKKYADVVKTANIRVD